MKCCSDNRDQQTQPRNKFKQSKESEPLKFKVLSFLGLKEYLIDKYVFLRSEPNYQIYLDNGNLTFNTTYQITISDQYEQQIKLIQDQKHSIHAISLNLKNRAMYSGTVIYSHGNSSDLAHSLSFISKFASNFPKFDYVVYDYTGYGKAFKKNVTEQTICEDLELLVQSIVAKPAEIILWGFSLGAYPTAKVAAKDRFKGVILQSPLASIYSLFTDNLSAYSTFDNDCFSILENIGNISSFLVLIHSKDDEVVPFQHSQILFQRHRMVSSNPLCFLVEVTALKHNHMHAFLCDKDKNKVRDTLHSYLNLMIESQNMSKGRQFQLQKEIYLNDIPKYQQIQQINIESREIKEQQSEKMMELRQSINFMAVKENVDFQLDDVTPQENVNMKNFMDAHSKTHRTYFEVSHQAKDETQVSQIQHQKLMNNFLND